MRQAWRWLLSVGAVTAVGASMLAQGGIAAAGTATAARGAARAGAAGGAHAMVAAAPAWTPVSRTLKPGMHGADVLKVQRRLKALKYYPGRPDGQFGPNTLEAVWAFKEVQGLKTRKNPDDIGAAMERRLASPRAPMALTRHTPNNRIDVNLRHEYLVLYRHGKVRLISHISSGGGYYFCDPPPNQGSCGYAITPTGNFTALSFAPGQVKVPLGEMFNPVFFIGRAFAIHGDSYVPRQPVSHGCVRIPDNIANFFHTLFTIPGTPIFIRKPAH
ncbi:MAG TPA: L,D-transpeptidase family protein [Streptosporangiaceae bacterium]|nr:L,D-transpeptidase family protein [Streptosporangiaceae bacterium]